LSPFAIIYQTLFTDDVNSPLSDYWNWWPTTFATREDAEQFAVETIERGGQVATPGYVTYSRVIDVEELPENHPLRERP
jgi:hypothetical protein